MESSLLPELSSLLGLATPCVFVSLQELDYKEFRMFAMACIDRQNEIDKLKREKVLAVARKESVKEKKKKFRAMLNDGSLETIVKAVRDRGSFYIMLHLYHIVVCMVLQPVV